MYSTKRTATDLHTDTNASKDIAAKHAPGQVTSIIRMQLDKTLKTGLQRTRTGLARTTKKKVFGYLMRATDSLSGMILNVISALK